MNKQKPRSARVFRWFCLGLSIVLIALYAAKSLFASDRDVSPALAIIGVALLFVSTIGFARAKKASQDE